MTHLTKYSFGATSAIATSLAFIVSLSGSPAPRTPIIGALLVLAVADNITDSLGIHVFQESDLKSQSTVNASTLSNFATRLVLVLSFVALVYLLPIGVAVAASIAWGVSILVTLSYLIATEQKADPTRAILQHVAIAALVVVSSLVMRDWITTIFP
jgi:VIT1/CCC1 family predicted Fe2+/Mn2+ transporter